MISYRHIASVSVAAPRSYPDHMLLVITLTDNDGKETNINIYADEKMELTIPAGYIPQYPMADEFKKKIN